MQLRRADLRSREHALALLEIRNLETSRRWSNDPEEVVAAETHFAYLAGRLGGEPAADRLVVYFVVDEDDQIVGYQRFDIDPRDAETWVISAALRATAQGQGWGTQSTRAAIERLRTDLGKDGRPLRTVHAWIHTDNDASIAMFARCGFVGSEQTIVDAAGRTMSLYVRALEAGS